MNDEQTPALREAVENMRNMRESYNQISAAAEVYNTGKPQLAASISAMGVPASAEDSLAEMAAKVRSIPQQVNTRTSDFEQMIAPYPYIWNVYTVATELMQNELPSYIPSYMMEYRSRYGANSFFIGEYYLGYATLELTGADGYLTCDGDFYTISNGVVTHTSPDGTIETYEAESIIHTWHDIADSMANRWVAFFYLADTYSFTNITSSICPRRVALCGTCNSFIVSAENRLTDIWVIGTLGHFEGGITGNTWNPAQVIQNYKKHSSGIIYNSPSNVNQIILTDTEEISGDAKVIANSFKDGIIIIAPVMKNILSSLVNISNADESLKNISIYVDNAEYIPNGVVTQSYRNGSHHNSAIYNIYIRNKKVLKSDEVIYKTISYIENNLINLNIDASGLKEINGYIFVNSYTNGYLIKQLNCNFKSLISCSSSLLGYNRYYGTIVADSDIIAPNAEYINGILDATPPDEINWATSNCKMVYFPKLKNFNSINSISVNCLGGDDVIDWWVGEMETNLNLAAWRAQNVTSNAEKTRTLLSNLRAHIYERISDRSTTTALTISFGFKSVLDNYSAGTEEENAEIIAAWAQLKSDFTNNKNWNVA